MPFVACTCANDRPRPRLCGAAPGAGTLGVKKSPSFRRGYPELKRVGYLHSPCGKPDLWVRYATGAYASEDSGAFT